jgi:hypothetical protein
LLVCGDRAVRPAHSTKAVGEIVMSFGVPPEILLQTHVVLSLIGIVSGLIVVYGLLTDRPLGGCTALFLATTILTSLTGFPLAPFGFDPPRAVGVISLVFLAIAVISLYVFSLAGAWRWIYICSALVALYLNCFVGVIQAFGKLEFLRALAPTQTEPPFVVAQVALLIAFIAFGFFSIRSFHPRPAVA